MPEPENLPMRLHPHPAPDAESAMTLALDYVHWVATHRPPTEEQRWTTEELLEATRRYGWELAAGPPVHLLLWEQAYEQVHGDLATHVAVEGWNEPLPIEVARAMAWDAWWTTRHPPTEVTGEGWTSDAG